MTVLLRHEDRRSAIPRRTSSGRPVMPRPRLPWVSRTSVRWTTLPSSSSGAGRGLCCWRPRTFCRLPGVTDGTDV